MIHDVQFDEPKELQIETRQLITREPGALSGTLIGIGIVRSVRQAKWLISLVIAIGFFASTYLLEAALSGPDIPPRPPSPLYTEYVAERNK